MLWQSRKKKLLACLFNRNIVQETRFVKWKRIVNYFMTCCLNKLIVTITFCAVDGKNTSVRVKMTKRVCAHECGPLPVHAAQLFRRNQVLIMTCAGLGGGLRNDQLRARGRDFCCIAFFIFEAAEAAISILFLMHYVLVFQFMCCLEPKFVVSTPAAL